MKLQEGALKESISNPLQLGEIVTDQPTAAVGLERRDYITAIKTAKAVEKIEKRQQSDLYESLENRGRI